MRIYMPLQTGLYKEKLSDDGYIIGKVVFISGIGETDEWKLVDISSSISDLKGQEITFRYSGDSLDLPNGDTLIGK